MNYVTQEVKLTVGEVTETIGSSTKNMNRDENAQNNYHECVTKTRKKRNRKK